MHHLMETGLLVLDISIPTQSPQCVRNRHPNDFPAVKAKGMVRLSSSCGPKNQCATVLVALVLGAGTAVAASETRDDSESPAKTVATAARLDPDEPCEPHCPVSS